jgi:hypothetical protein
MTPLASEPKKVGILTGEALDIDRGQAAGH